MLNTNLDLITVPNNFRRIAADYHGGQFTALYAATSSGTIEVDDPPRLVGELQEAVSIAEGVDDREALKRFLQWAELQERKFWEGQHDDE